MIRITFFQSRLKFDKAEAIYKKLLERKDIQPTLVCIHAHFAAHTFILFYIIMYRCMYSI